MSKIELPQPPSPSIRVTHETDTVYCSDVPKDQVPPHDDYWSLAMVNAHGKACARAALERAAKICDGLTVALDHGGNEYRREVNASRCAAAIRAEIERD
jgi:hypothetical protein